MLPDEVAFHSLDTCLAKLLLDSGCVTISRTHQLMPDELGTARKVISLQLKRFEQKNWVTLGRGYVGISNRTALKKW